MATKDITDKQVCEAYREYVEKQKADIGKVAAFRNYSDAHYPYQILHQKTGQCEKVCFRACERAASRGLVDYGVSLRTGWLTDSGKALL